MNTRKRFLFSITLLGFLIGGAERPATAADARYGNPMSRSVAGPLVVRVGVTVAERDWSWSHGIFNRGDEPLALNPLFEFQLPGQRKGQFPSHPWSIPPGGFAVSRVRGPLPEEVESGPGAFTITAIVTSLEATKNFSWYAPYSEIQDSHDALRPSIRGPLIARATDTFCVP